MFNTAHLHPMIVHFPVALITVGFLAELAYWFYKKEVCLSKTGLYMIILGTLGALAAIITGWYFTAELKGTAGEVKETHELFAKITFFVMLILCIFRLYLVYTKKEESKLRWIVLVLYALGAGLAGYTGYLGGTLVMNYMIGL